MLTGIPIPLIGQVPFNWERLVIVWLPCGCPSCIQVWLVVLFRIPFWGDYFVVSGIRSYFIMLWRPACSLQPMTLQNLMAFQKESDTDRIAAVVILMHRQLTVPESE